MLTMSFLWWLHCRAQHWPLYDADNKAKMRMSLKGSHCDPWKAVSFSHLVKQLGKGEAERSLLVPDLHRVSLLSVPSLGTTWLCSRQWRKLYAIKPLLTKPRWQNRSVSMVQFNTCSSVFPLPMNQKKINRRNSLMWPHVKNVLVFAFIELLFLLLLFMVK